MSRDCLTSRKRCLMNNAPHSRLRSLPVILLICGVQAMAQQLAPGPVDVMGGYSCQRSAGEPSEPLFLLPDMKWDRVPPFRFNPGRIGWARVQTRGWVGRVPYIFNPNGIFRMQPGTVEIYNVEFVEDPYTGHFGMVSRWELINKLERPSALPELQPVFAMRLVQRFHLDQNSRWLTEILPSGSAREPSNCSKEPLFTERHF